jgi:(2Fe-2S) ferredoxin
MSDEEAIELPVVFKYHCFVCCQQRPAGHPRGSCGAAGAAPLWERLMSRVNGAQLTNVSVATTGCLGFCSAGPLMVVYPEGVWYQPKSIADIDRIVDGHFVGGRLEQDLVVILTR